MSENLKSAIRCSNSDRQVFRYGEILDIEVISGKMRAFQPIVVNR